MKPANPFLADALALVAGLLLPLAFAPAGVFPVAFLSPLMLMLAWRTGTPRRAFLRGWLYGAGSFGIGVSWIHESFRFNDIGLGVAIPLTVAFVAFLALYPALLGFALRRAPAASETQRMLLLFPAAWVLVEWLRGWLFTGFTWLQLGYSQVDSPLAGFLPVAGVYGVGWLVALCAALIGVALSAGSRGRVACVAAVILVGIAGEALRSVRFTRAAGPPLEVALLQGNIPQDQKWLPAMRQPTLDRYAEFTRQVLGADLIVWPETAVPELLHRAQPFIEALDAAARARGSAVLFGIPSIDQSTRRFFNTLVLVGTSRGFYHKRHLVPFGEYLPLDALLRPVTRALGIPVSNFSPGTRGPSLLSVAGHPLSVSICYEIAFGAEIIEALPAARLLVTVSNDAWFGTSIGPHQHFEIARVRALESGRYLLRATNTGITAIVGPDGRTVARLAQFEPGILQGEVRPMAGATPYVVLGDFPVVFAALLTFSFGLAAGIGRRRRDDRDPSA